MAEADEAQAGKTTNTKPTGATASAKKPGAKAPKAKSGSRTSKAKPGSKPRFDAKFLDDMRRKLLKERAKYLHSAEEYQAEAESLLATREPGDVQFDEEGGEGTTVAVERERDLALSSQARHTVSQIDAALERIDNGTYGYCITSGAPIPIARLRAIPWAAERVEVKAGGLGRR